MTIECPLSVNAANLTSVVRNDRSTYTTGYPPVYTTATPKPYEVDLTSLTVNGRSGFANFTATDDLPAVMFDKAIMDIEGPTNICGVIYSATYIEFEFEHEAYTAVDHDGDLVADTWAMQPLGGSTGELQYINGAIYGGGGILFRPDLATTEILLNYDVNTVDSLPYTAPGGAPVITELRRKAFAIGE